MEPTSPKETTQPVPAPSREVAPVAPQRFDIKAKASNLAGQIPERPKKILIILTAILVVLIVLVIGVSLFRGMRRPSPRPISTPTPSAEPTPTGEEILNPSRYATDSAVLSIEEDIKKVEGELNSVDLKEDNLRPPTLDFNVSF